MARPQIFVTRHIPAGGLRLLEATCDVTIWPDALPPTREALLAHARDCDGLLTLLSDRIDGEVLDRCPRVRVVSNMAVGYDNIDVQAATARGVFVGNTPNVLDETTADCAFALLLALARRIPEAIAYVREDSWETWGPLLLLGRDVHHATLGIVGLGRIGEQMAQRARGFDMRILYAGPQRHPETEARLGLEYTSLPDLLRQSDFISLHAPLTPQTRGMFGPAAFAQMQPTAMLINTSRGPLVDTDALLVALQMGIIGGAALDVSDPEPMRAHHPLVQLPNCIVVPHIASASEQTRTRMAEIAARNLLAGLHGEALPAGVNPDAAHHGRQAELRT